MLYINDFIRILLFEQPTLNFLPIVQLSADHFYGVFDGDQRGAPYGQDQYRF